MSLGFEFSVKAQFIMVEDRRGSELHADEFKVWGFGFRASSASQGSLGFRV